VFGIAFDFRPNLLEFHVLAGISCVGWNFMCWLEFHVLAGISCVGWNFMCWQNKIYKKSLSEI